MSEAKQSHDTHEVREHSHKEILTIMAGLMTGILLAALDQTVVSTALKSIVEDFNGLVECCEEDAGHQARHDGHDLFM